MRRLGLARRDWRVEYPELLKATANDLAQLAQLGGGFCGFAGGDASRIKGLDGARG